MKQNPTPGKFTVSTEYPYSGGKPRDFIAVVDESGDELARMNPGTPRPIAMANAELFASAPKMLARLIALGRMVEMHCCGRMIPEDLAQLSPVESAMLNGRMKAQDDFDGRLEQEEGTTP